MIAPKARWTKATVAKYQAHLRRLMKEEGKLTPKIIVDDARSPSSPTHGIFEWDDTAAGERWRLHQARQMMCKLRVNIGTDEEPKMVRTMFVVTDDDGDDSYRPLAEIKADSRLSDQILDRAKSDMKCWIERYGIYKELFAAKKLATQLLLALEGVKGRK